MTTSVTDPDGIVLAIVSRLVEPLASGGLVTVVAVNGEIDHDTAAVVRGVLLQAVDDSAAVCFDLTRVSFFGSVGVHTVVAAYQHAVELRRMFCLRGVGGFTRRVLQAARLTDIIVDDS